MNSGIKVRWYPLLRKPEGKETPYLMEYSSPEPKTLVVCQQLKVGNDVVRHFAKFNNYIDFARYNLLDVKLSHRCFYEVIFGEMPQKPYFDLDIKLECPEVKSQDLCLSEEESGQLCKQVVEGILKVIPVNPSDIMIFTSHSKEKHSYHIVVDNWCFPDYRENKAFSLEVIQLVSPKFRPFIDSSMYKSLQQFRILGSHKWESERIKILDSSSLWKPPIQAENSDHLFILQLSGSLVSNVSYCSLLPSFSHLVPQKPTFVFDATDLTPNEVEKCLNFCAKCGNFKHFSDPGFPYRFQETKGHLILLKRISRSFCRVCNRIHESENPFLTISGVNRDVFFNCRRGNSKFQIGTLGPISPPVSISITPPPIQTPVLPIPISQKPCSNNLLRLSAEHAKKRVQIQTEDQKMDVVRKVHYT